MEVMVAEPVLEAGSAGIEARPVNTGRFRPGHKPLGGGSNKGVKKPSEYLRDLRRVYRTKDGSADTRGQAALRKVFEESPKDFLDRLHKAEAEHRRGAVKSGSPIQGSQAVMTQSPADELSEDDGVERGLGEVERMLREKPWPSQ